MKQFYKTEQKHHFKNTSYNQNSLSFDTFTYLNKDEFLRRKRQAQNMPKENEMSTPSQSIDLKQLKTVVKKGYYKVQSTEKTLKPSRNQLEYQPFLNNTRRKMNQRALNFDQKGPSGRNRHRDRQNLLTTCPQQFVETEIKIQPHQIIHNKKKVKRDIDLSVDRIIQTPFRKPYDSKVLFENPVVYDTLMDNRFCGFNVCSNTDYSTNQHVYRQVKQKIREFK